jgi:metal-sulfur cluster biosynthetic enzyme
VRVPKQRELASEDLFTRHGILVCWRIETLRRPFCDASAIVSRMDTEQARDQVWQAIRTVTDPELDESITDLGFVQSVAITQLDSADPSAIADASVLITFRLPTYWCAANFAFMMAEDLRERVMRLPWVREARVELVDHFTAEEINRGIAGGQSFSASFPDEGGGNLADLRRLFRLKAFQRRQYRLLRHLLDALHDRAELLGMTITQLRDLTLTDQEGAKFRNDYLAILPEFLRRNASPALTSGSVALTSGSVRTFAAGVSSRSDSGVPSSSSVDSTNQPPADSLAFVLPNGSPLDVAHLDDHLRQLRRTTINIEFNSAICSSLLKSRNNNPTVAKLDEQLIE